MKCKPVKVWVVWRRVGDGWVAVVSSLSRQAALYYRDTNPGCRITSGTVNPPGEGKQ